MKPCYHYYTQYLPYIKEKESQSSDKSCCYLIQQHHECPKPLVQSQHSWPIQGSDRLKQGGLFNAASAAVQLLTARNINKTTVTATKYNSL